VSSTYGQQLCKPFWAIRVFWIVKRGDFGGVIELRLRVLIWYCGAEVLLLPFGASSVNNWAGWWWGDYWRLSWGCFGYDIIRQRLISFVLSLLPFRLPLVILPVGG
jgi:hypothetical protein